MKQVITYFSNRWHTSHGSTSGYGFNQYRLALYDGIVPAIFGIMKRK